MRLVKIVCVSFMTVVLLTYSAAAQENDGSNSSKRADNTAFIFSFTAIVMDVVDGCTVKVEIKEGRRGLIQGQEFVTPSSNPDYNGTKNIRLVNTKCVSMDESVSSKSKEMLEKAVKNEIVEVSFRTYADIKNFEVVGQLIIVESRKDAGLEQLKSGMAMFRSDKEKSVSEADRRKYKDAERTAKENKLGMWSIGN